MTIAALACAACGLVAISALSVRAARREASLRQASDRIAYAANTRAANIAMQAGDVDVASLLLERADSTSEDWEASWLRAGIEKNLSSIDLPLQPSYAQACPPGRDLLRGEDRFWVLDLASMSTRALSPAPQIKGSQLRTCVEHDGRHTYVLSDSRGKLHLRDAVTGEKHLEQEMTPGTFVFLGIPGSSDLLISGLEQTSRLDVSTGHWLWQTAPGAGFGQLLVAPDGRHALATGRRQIEVIDLHTGLSRVAAGSSRGRFWSQAWSRDSSSIVVASADGCVLMGDIETLSMRSVLTGQLARVLAMDVRADGLLATGHENGHVRVWDLQSGTSLADWTTMTNHGMSPRILRVWFAPEDRIVGASAAGLRTFPLREIPNPRVLDEHRASNLDRAWVNGLALHPGGRLFATGGSDKVVLIRELPSGRVVHSIALGEPVRHLAFHPDGRWLAVTLGGNLIFLDWEQSQIAGQWQVDLGWGEPVFTADGKEVWIPGANQTSRAQPPFRLDLPPTPAGLQRSDSSTPGLEASGITVMRFAPDGRRIEGYASGLCIVRATDGRVVHRLPGHTDRITGMVVSPDGEQLATTSTDGSAILWDLTSGHEVLRYAEHGGAEIQAIAFAPGGRRVATGDHLGRINLWETTQGTTVLTLSGHTDYVIGLRFSADGTTLISISGDGSVRLWRTRCHEPE